MEQHTANENWDPSASTAEEPPQKIKQPQAEVSILPGGTRSLSEVAGRGHRLRLWKRSGQTGRLEVVGGVIFVR